MKDVIKHYMRESPFIICFLNWLFVTKKSSTLIIVIEIAFDIPSSRHDGREQLFFYGVYLFGCRVVLEENILFSYQVITHQNILLLYIYINI